MNPVLLRCANLTEAEIFLKESRKYSMHLSQRNDDLWSSNKALIAHLSRRTRAAPTVSNEELHKFSVISASDSNSAISELVRSSFCNAERLLI